jgi:hypothetical protein
MMKAKLAAGVLIALAVAVFAGWAWGATGRSAINQELETSELRADLLGARAAALDARVALYATNFGEASQHLEGARGLLRRAAARITSAGRPADADQLATALAQIDDAQRMTGKLDPSANARVGEAAQIMAKVLAGPPR